MKTTTDRYDAAKRADAKPIFYLYLETDTALRCFGKETPDVAHISSNTLEWSARVLMFGDLRQSLSSNADSIVQSLFEAEMGTYVAVLDNADGYFSDLAGKEIILGGEVTLVQGFKWPSFVESDFLTLFTGSVKEFELTTTRFVLRAAQALQSTVPDDPSVTPSYVYALTTTGVGDVGASDTFSYATMSPVFYDDDDWTFTAEIDKDAIDTAEVLFKIENNAYDSTRIEIGINASNQLYVKACADVDTASPVYVTSTSDFTIGTTATRVTVELDYSAGIMTFYDSFGQSTIVVLEWETVFTYVTTFGSGTLLFPSGIARASNGNLYITDNGNHRIVIYQPDGTYIGTFGSSGSGNGQFNNPSDIDIDSSGNIYVADTGNHRVQKFNSSHTYVTQWGGYGTGDGQFYSPEGICVDTLNGAVYVADTWNHRIQRFSDTGTYTNKTGSSGSGNGEFSFPIGIDTDSLNNVYVVDYGNHRVQKFTSGLVYASQFGSSGSGDGEFSTPTYCLVTSGNEILVSDTGNNRIQLFDGGVFQAEFAPSAPNNFTNVRGLAWDSLVTFFAVDKGGTERVLKFTGSQVLHGDFDRTDTGSSDDIVVLEDFDGTATTMSIARWQAVCKNNTDTEWADIISGLDVSLADGTWTEELTLDTADTAPETTTDPDATDDIILPNTSRYSDTGINQQNVILPLLYGDLTENSDTGVSVCPLIDDANHVFCVSGWPILSVANGNVLSVYVDGVLTPSGWTFDESNNYESQGNIAILTFTSDPGGTVTIKCSGKASGGVLLTNPIDIIEDFIEYAAELNGVAPWQTDESSLAQAKAYASAQSYVAAGVIQSQNTLGYWVKAILKPFLGDFRFSDAGLLQIKFQSSDDTANVFDTLIEYEAINLNAKQSLENICGRIVINYAVSYATIDRRFKNNSTISYFRTSDKSQEALNPQTWTLDLDWCRKTANIEFVQDILLALYADPEYIVSYQGQDFKFIPLELKDHVQGTISFLRDENGEPIEDVVYAIREKTINMDDFTTSLILQSVNFVTVVDAEANYITLGHENVTLGTTQATLGGV